MSRITVKNLYHTYQPGTPFMQAALEDISLDIGSGELVGIIGHTGSGKSTLVSHLNGLLKPTSGQILLDGNDIWGKNENIRQVRFRVGLVFQYPEYQLFEETVYKDIAFGPKNMKLPDDQIKERVEMACSFVGLPADTLEKSPFELSGGQKRRVAIAGVIAMQPDILILDEPTAGLDPQGREEVLYHIRQYHAFKGSTIIIVSHSMEDVAKNVNRIIVMNKGKIFADGRQEQIFAMEPELLKIGLSVPAVTSVFNRLEQMGLSFGQAPHTVEQAVELLLPKLK